MTAKERLLGCHEIDWTTVFPFMPPLPRNGDTRTVSLPSIRIT